MPATLDIAGLRPREVLDFLDTLENAVGLLDDLAQIQAICGGLGMQSRATRTENVMAKLQYFARHLRHNQELINR